MFVMISEVMEMCFLYLLFTNEFSFVGILTVLFGNFCSLSLDEHLILSCQHAAFLCDWSVVLTT